MPSEPAAASTSLGDHLPAPRARSLNAGTFANWFGAATRDRAGRTTGWSSPSRTSSPRRWIEGHFSSLLDAAAAEHELVRRAARRGVRGGRRRAGSRRRDDLRTPVAESDRGGDRAAARSGINPRYTFDVFVIGAEQPVRPRRGARRGRVAGAGLQPAVHLRQHRPGENPPAAGGRPVRAAAAPQPQRSLCDDRDGPERVRRCHAGSTHGRIQAAVSHVRRSAGRRHPVHRGQGASPGGVFPHLQQPLRGREADRHLVGSAAAGAGNARGAAAVALRVGPASPTSSRPISRRASPSCARR